MVKGKNNVFHAKLWVGLVISIASQFCALEKILDILKSHCPSSLMSSHEQERGCSQLGLLTTTIYLQYTVLWELPYLKLHPNVQHYEKKLTKNIRPTNVLQIYTKFEKIY